MRSIKFRVWDARRQKWYHKIIEWAFDKPKGSIGQLPELPEGTIISQFTGLLDKQGKEIYEGDIVTADYLVMTSRYKVTIEDGHTQLVHVRNNTLRFFLSKDNIEVYEVIGNIYENPELLKEQQ